MQKKEFLENRQRVTYLDLFAGAGGFSEGFLQAFTENLYYDFKLASDINENCELTHRVRYNSVLGLDTKFLRQDIMEDTFIENLLYAVGNEPIDVITGGPSCQSFSLAGRRKVYDKRDDLFYHYLKVIKALRPKYFVMENVKGILTKDGGAVKRRILREIRSIIDPAKAPLLTEYINSIKNRLPSAVYAVLKGRIIGTESIPYGIFDTLDALLRDITKNVDYRVSKSDQNINTVRHGILLLKLKNDRENIRKSIIQLKTATHIDNDVFIEGYNAAISALGDEDILEKIFESIDKIAKMKKKATNLCSELKKALELLVVSFDECIEYIYSYLDNNEKKIFNSILAEVRLYNISEPMVLLSSNYGVPQNRERVVFIGCRNDQPLIDNIPSLVSEDEKVTVFEALWDLDNIDNGETVEHYRKPRILKKYECKKKLRSVDGNPISDGKLYSDWSRQGRLGERFVFECPPFYVHNFGEYNDDNKHQNKELFNHQTSSQSDTVRERLRIIAKHGDYDESKVELKEKGLDSQKRNYVVLKPEGQSPTVCTMPDDFIHYAAFRPTTVREMARLQSFDDSFVFQGKRQTGGNNRQKEIPQYTLVGNAVPPLMAKAIANVILKNIK